jgi:tetratricopeptide (TPR) repeat protein
MSHHLSRAEILLAQSRPADAEREARLALGQAPTDPLALTVLARALADQNREKDALAPIRAAVAAAPDSPYVHHVHAHVLLRLDRPKEALAASDTALRLAPDDGDLLAQRAGIRLALREWPAALADAEAALRINAEDTFAQNLRATALRQLGRAGDAAVVGARTLEQNPEDAFSHSTQGWTLLQHGDPRGAQTHFREALRLRPDFEPARQGMLEALKARNPVYRGMLAYFLWMGRQSGRIQWAFFFVTLFGQRLVRNLASSNATLGLVLWPLLVFFYVFVYLSWTAIPLFNLLLRLDRQGRHVLSRQERRDTNWFGASVLLVLAAAAWWASGGGFIARLAVIITAVLSVCVAATVTRPGPRGRLILGLATAALALVALAASVLAFTGLGNGAPLLTLFFIGFLAFQFGAAAIKG